MVRGDKFVLQLFRIVFGFVAGILAAGLFLSWGFFQAAAPDHDPVAFAAMIGTGLVTASVVGGFAFIPAGIAILAAELMRWRSFVFHLGAAGAIGLALWTFGEEAGTTGLRPGTTIALAAGFLAGAVYWLIAGRSSGCWRTDDR